MSTRNYTPRVGDHKPFSLIDWIPSREAWDMYDLVKRGVITIERAVHDITMTDKDRIWLLNNRITAPENVAILYQKRRECLLIFLRIVERKGWQY